MEYTIMAVKIVAAGVIGTLMWPVLEYTLHRFLGHELPWKSKFRTEHLRHHAEGNFFAPLHLKLLAAIIIVGGLELILLVSGLDSVFAVAFAIGLLANYARYEFFHMALHAREPKNERERRLAKHHLYHHFGNYQMNHGVTSRWFDRVCKTYREPGLIKVPKHLAPEWLVKNAEKYTDTFRVVERAPKVAAAAVEIPEIEKSVTTPSNPISSIKFGGTLE